MLDRLGTLAMESWSRSKSNTGSDGTTEAGPSCSESEGIAEAGRRRTQGRNQEHGALRGTGNGKLQVVGYRNQKSCHLVQLTHRIPGLTFGPMDTIKVDQFYHKQQRGGSDLEIS